MLSHSAGQPVGPPSDLERYKLLDLVASSSPPEREHEWWRAERQRDGKLVEVKLIAADPDFAHSEFAVFEGGEGWTLWAIAGFSDPPSLGPNLSLPPSTCPSSHPGKQHCIAILDSFFLPPPRDFPADLPLEDFYLDAALVLEPLGPSLETWRKEQAQPPPLDTVRRSVRQVLLALDYVHSELKFSHNAVSLQSLHLKQPLALLELSLFDRLQISRLLFNKNLTSSGLDLSFHRLGDGPLEQWSVNPEVVVSLASLAPEDGWPSFFDSAAGPSPDFSSYSDFPFYLPDVTPLPSIRERILSEPAAATFSSSEIDLLTSFLQACWTLNPYKRPSAKDLLEHEFVEEDA
ncbi:hypothetical protein JCM6882_004759 [Rhodosporidiobolus microsporus]